MRKRYFPNPVPDSFYTGNATKHPQAGLLQDYYAWEWGDALFVVLDPFWFTQKQRGQSDNWKRTLGAEQYQWLKRTLEAQQSEVQVRLHPSSGRRRGRPGPRRSGSRAVLRMGRTRIADGSDGFRQNRPGWPMPIHQLLVQNQVTIVFHGHDHFYAKQDLDGIVYQEVPQPGDPARQHPQRGGIRLQERHHPRQFRPPEGCGFRQPGDGGLCPHRPFSSPFGTRFSHGANHERRFTHLFHFARCYGCGR